MIIVKFCGGLGNQMYQLAMLVAMREEYSNQSFKADISHYSLFEEHNGFELESCFGIKLNYASIQEVRKVYVGLTPSKSYLYLPREIRDFIVHKFQWKYNAIMEKVRPDVAKKTVTEANYLNKKKLMDSGDWYINGMWQDTKYFGKYQNEIVKEFNVNPLLEQEDKMIVRDLSDGDAIAVHVRGGDFLKIRGFNLCGKEYYSKALMQIGVQKPLYIFTDDPSYAKEIFMENRIAGIVTHGIKDSIKDMYMMSKAKYLVVSNSTFSFWSAFLNTSSNKIVCPKYATKNKNGYTAMCVCENWGIVDNSVSTK